MLVRSLVSLVTNFNMMEVEEQQGTVGKGIPKFSPVFALNPRPRGLSLLEPLIMKAVG